MLEVPELTKRTRADWLPRLRYAYADALAEAGRTDDALVWFHRAAGVDGDGLTGAAERAAELEGLEFTDLDEDDTVLDDEYFEDETTDTDDTADVIDAADAADAVDADATDVDDAAGVDGAGGVGEDVGSDGESKGSEE